MTQHELRFAISRQQQAHQNTLLMALLISLVGIISAALGPQVVYEYLLQGASVDLQMMVLQYFPVIAYGAVMASLVWAVVSAIGSGRRVRMYDQELQLLNYTDMASGTASSVSPQVSDDTEGINVEPKKSATKTTKSSAKKKSTKSTASKKKSAKKSE